VAFRDGAVESLPMAPTEVFRNDDVHAFHSSRFIR
jgi:hypothetical protein